MSEVPPPKLGGELNDRFLQLGRRFGEREAEHAESLAAARACAEKLHDTISRALADFHRGAGMSQLEVSLSEVRADDKHVRAVEFELVRGRHRAIVTAKSRGEVTLVGPFHAGKTEGPCRSFPFDAGPGPELCEALGDFLEKFLEAASTS
jgi:hypothetical protein